MCVDCTIPPKVVFQKIHPVLKPGGKFIVTTPNFASLLNILLLVLGKNPIESFPEDVSWVNRIARDIRVHPREYTVKEIEDALSASGFQIHSMTTKLRKTGGHPNLKLRLVRALMWILPRHRETIIAVGIAK